MASRTEAQKIMSYRYLHANMRLRTRYGIEIDFDEYAALCRMFQVNSKEIRGLRTNELGDREGWVRVKGVWVCAHYKVRANLIATFMPAPPPLVEGELPALKPSETLAAENAKLRKVIDRMNREQNEIVTERARKQFEDRVHALGKSQENVKQDLAWVLARLKTIESLLISGDVEQATDRLQVLIRMAADMKPGSLNNPEYDALVQAATENRAYWNEKFNSLKKPLETSCPPPTPATQTPTTVNER